MSSKKLWKQSKNLVSVLILSGLASYTNAQEVYRGKKANDLIENAEIVRSSAHSNLPSYIKFYPGKEIDLDGLNLWLKKNLQLAPGVDFVLLRKETDQLGHIHYRYRQTWNGIPVDAATLIAHTHNDKVYSINGNFYQNFTATTSASVTDSDAINAAMEFVGAESYKWQLEGEEEHLKWEQNDESATYYPSPELVLVSDDYSFRPESFKAALKMNIYAHQPVSRAWIYVDATTGEVIQKNKILVDVDEAGTAETQYSGSQTIIADSFGGEYRLRDGSRGLGVRTFDLNTGTDYGSAVDFTDDDNNWNNVNPELDEYATDAHFGAEMTYDYYWIQHGRNSIDDAGFQLNSYVHYSNDYVNAFWDGTRMTYGDGNATYSPLTSMDIAGHEVTHGLTTFSAGLIYYAESGALNESFSDIFGTAIENFSTPGDWDWLIGEDIGAAFRSMSNPNIFGDPDTYFGSFWASLTGGDSGGVHTNSGVQNFWYYLLNNGGSGTNDNGDAYTVTGQGWDVASNVAFRNLTVYLTESSDYAEARFYGIQSATDLYGGCSPEVEATTNAWYAVGVGPIYSSEVIANLTSEDTLACSAPFTVDFSNISVNGITYEWDFGDGSTSTDASPTHDYLDIGEYTVTLIVDGGACGTDTLTLVDYVVIDTTIPCIVNLPSTGVGNTQTSCDGTLYDSGGPDFNYGANETAQITISPFGASTVNLEYVMFDVEAGPSGTCNYDYMQVFDGPDTDAPLVDTYCNNNLPPATWTSSGSSVTILFSSDPGVQDPGFEINWNCNLPTVPPIPDFVSDIDTTCTGTIAFSDLTTEGPLPWDWDFGDGNTSTEQNPVHSYTSSGLYTVSLTTTNAIGSASEVKTDYIFVQLPIAPTGIDDTVCVDNPADLMAAGSGELVWYADEFGGAPLFTGSTYTTPSLSMTTSFWVEDQIESPAVNEGPLDNSFGGGGFFTGDQHLIFDCTTPVILNSVKVYANGSGNRTIEFRDNLGTVIESATIFIPDGEQTVDLNWEIPVGTNYQLGTEEDSDPDLFRNNSGPSYPYNLSGVVEITNSSAGEDYYYFFYDWELQEYPCISPRTEVFGVVGEDTTVMIDPVETICPSDSPVTVTTGASGGSWSASCGDCIDPITGEFNPSEAGVGEWTVDYVIPGYCGTSSPIMITVADETPVNINPVDPLCHEGGAVILTTDGTGGTWSADCGSCIDAETGEFNPGLAGDGSWTVTYNLVDICDHSNSIEVEVISCLGIDEETEKLISIYPNPAKDQITINTANLNSGYIKLTDVVGREVLNMTFNENKTEVDLSHLQARSTYFVHILDENGEVVTIRKVIKQ